MVAPVNPQRRRGPAAVPRGAAAGWLTPAAVARVTGGEVLQRGRTAASVTTDSRQSCEGLCFVALKGPNHDGHDHAGEAVRKGARGLLVQRPLPELGTDRLASGQPFVVRVPDTGAALLQLAAEHRRRHRARVIGITGSCGKTTTKEWLGAVLESVMPAVRSPASFNNQVGVPLTLFRIRPETRAAVVEIGTNAPGEIAQLAAVARPDIAIVTCVAAAHLEGLGSLAGVAKEKSALPAAVDDDGLCILNGDDVACRAMAEVTRARTQFVAVDRPADWFATDVRFHGLGTTFLLQGQRPVTLPRLGTHNVYNALFVIAAASELGLPEGEVLQALAQAPAAARRLEAKQAGGVTVFDDTYNMNPASARAGLQALMGLQGAGRRIAVFGEMLELGQSSEQMHRDLGRDAAAAGLHHLVCVGAPALAEGALAAGMAAQAVHRVADVAGALAVLRELVREGDRVLCKASRRVQLDRLVDQLLAALAGRAAAAAGAPVAPAAGAGAELEGG